MKESKGGVIAKIRAEQPKVTDINCVCHVNLSVKSAVKMIPPKNGEFLVDLFYHFYHSVESFSLICQIKTDSVLLFATEIVYALIACYFNNTAVCETSKFDDSSLLQAKICTYLRNLP